MIQSEYNTAKEYEEILHIRRECGKTLVCTVQDAFFKQHA